MLTVTRRSAAKARTQAANQIHALVVTAPEPLKHQLKGMKLKARVAVCARWRPGQAQTTVAYAKKALRYLARRYRSLDTEIAQLDVEIRSLCAKANPALLAAEGVGSDTAAGDNPERMNSEASFAALCGASPVHASSGQTTRHRLNRGGNRQANNALWRIATTRMRHDATTKDYVAKWSSPRGLDTRFMRPCDGSSCPPIRLVAAVRSWSEAGGGCTRLRSTIGLTGGLGAGCGSRLGGRVLS